MMDFLNIVLGVAVPLLLIIFGIIGYFLRTLHSDVKTSITEQAHNYSKMSEDIGKLKGKIELVEQEGRLKYTIFSVQRADKTIRFLQPSVRHIREYRSPGLGGGQPRACTLHTR